MREHQQIEWKESWRDEYLKWICGFANAEGGVLVIGRNDEGVAVGVANAQKLLEDLPNKNRDVLGVMANVNLVKKSGKELIKIRVDVLPDADQLQGRILLSQRQHNAGTQGAGTGAVSDEEARAALGRRPGAGPHRSIMYAPLPSSFSSNVPGKAAAWTVRCCEIAGKSSSATWQLTEKHWLRRAACLLFSDRPEKYVSGAWIKVGFFVTDDDLRYQDEVHGNLFGQVDATLELLHTKYLKAYITYHGIHRRETFLFPESALREALLNAVVHKDYRCRDPHSDQRLRRSDRLLESRRFAQELDSQETARQAPVGAVQPAHCQCVLSCRVHRGMGTRH